MQIDYFFSLCYDIGMEARFYMEEMQKPKKNISDIVRKLLKSNDVSVKTAALYLNCTEQSFRNKLSRDSFSLKDLIILCYLCNARFMIEYFSYKEDYDIDFFDPSDYLSEEEYDRIHNIEQEKITENLAKIIVQLSKTVPEDQLEKISSKELLDIMIEQSREKLASKKAKYESEKHKE